MRNGTTKNERTSISHSTTIIGNIRAEEHLVINGTVKGNIEVKDFSLFIGPSGRLEGDILAKNVKVRGYRQGKIYAKGKVEIAQETHFLGEVISKGILVEKGAYFDASVKLGRNSQITESLSTSTTDAPQTEIC